MLSFEILLPITHTFHWELKPFFYLFRKYWNQQVTILSDVDPKIPHTRFVPIRHTISSDWSGSFSNNLSSYLKNDSQSDFVIIMMADYWLTKSVNQKRIRALVEFMTNHQDVVRLQISNGMDSNSSEVLYRIRKYELKLEIRDRKEFFRGSLIPGLWSKKLLIDLLRPNQDIWSTEQTLSKDIEESNLKSYLVMPEIIKYEHIVKTSSRTVDFTKSVLKDKVINFIPDRFQIYG